MKSERGRRTPYEITYTWNLECDTSGLGYWNKSRLPGIASKVKAAKGETGEKGEGQIRSLGLADTNYYLYNRQQGTTFNIL